MEQSAKQRLIKKAVKYNFILIIVGLAIRPFIVPTTLSFLPWAIINLLIYGLVYYFVRSDKLGEYSALALFTSTFFALISLLLLSGGINGHIAYILPLVPVFAGLILSERAFWLTSLFNILLIIAMAVYTIPPDVTSMPPEISRKMIWLVLANLMGAAFSRAYVKENELLATALKHEANIDYLTRVLNRRGIERKLDQEIQLAKNFGRSLCLMMIDLDHFKRYNDLNGHLAGDCCLRDISERLNDLVRAKGGFIGRYGGEEFIVVLSDLNASQANNFAQVLNFEVRDMAIPLGKGMTELLTTSVGYCYRESANILDAEAMIYDADRKLYQCKAEGRDLVRGDIIHSEEPLSA